MSFLILKYKIKKTRFVKIFNISFTSFEVHGVGRLWSLECDQGNEYDCQGI